MWQKAESSSCNSQLWSYLLCSFSPLVVKNLCCFLGREASSDRPYYQNIFYSYTRISFHDSSSIVSLLTIPLKCFNPYLILPKPLWFWWKHCTIFSKGSIWWVWRSIQLLSTSSYQGKWEALLLPASFLVQTCILLERGTEEWHQVHLPTHHTALEELLQLNGLIR